MHFTQPQVSKILEDILQKEDGLNTILKLSLEQTKIEITHFLGYYHFS